MKNIIAILLLLPTMWSYGQKKEEIVISDKKDYTIFTSFGQLIGSSADEKGSISSLRIASSLNIGEHLAIGLTTGMEWFDVALLPVGPDIKLFLPSKNKNTFFFQGAVGHSFPLEDVELEYFEVLETKGGMFAQTHLGYIFQMEGNWKLFMALGYQYQNSSHVQEHWIYQELERKIKYNRFSVRLGFKLF